MAALNLPAVVLTRPKYPHNLAAAIRACACFDVGTLLWTGGRFSFEAGARLPREERMKGYRAVTFEQTDRPFDRLLDSNDAFTPVCVELSPTAQPLSGFEHPDDAVYVFGPEDGSVPQVYRRFCHSFVYIPSRHCLNLSAALNVVLYDRMLKRIAAGLPVATPASMLNEERGLIETVPGWEGR